MSTKRKIRAHNKISKERDPSWQLRMALGHKIEANSKSYTRKVKHPESIKPDEA